MHANMNILISKNFELTSWDMAPLRYALPFVSRWNASWAATLAADLDTDHFDGYERWERGRHRQKDTKTELKLELQTDVIKTMLNCSSNTYTMSNEHPVIIAITQELRKSGTPEEKERPSAQHPGSTDSLVLCSGPEREGAHAVASRQLELRGLSAPSVQVTEAPSLRLRAEGEGLEADTNLFLTDREMDVNRKVKKAFCEPENVDFCPPLDWVDALLPLSDGGGASSWSSGRRRTVATKATPLWRPSVRTPGGPSLT
ncbi:unnamed protein product [Prorocentrum cordatum]|uniref:Uncharacterized protein n=1 Tax=Prorocentrum cordatum TaxID=2364126 RepID=A0ABN9Q7X1_9DINO|nr:unnamed protein product [Polarella glacialis]